MWNLVERKIITKLFVSRVANEVLEGLKPDDIVVKGPYKAISKELEEGSVVKIDNEIKKKDNKED